MADKQKIFISGPMFSPADLWEGKEIKAALVDAGFDTYWAPEDGIEDERLIKNLQSPLMAMTYYQKVALLVQKLGWTLDIYMATFGCDAMVMDMNGRVPDGGSIVEAANAYSCGMPLVLYKETSITMWGPFNNPMIAALTKDWEPVDTVDKIAPALERGDRGTGRRLPIRTAACVRSRPGDRQVRLGEPRPGDAGPPRALRTGRQDPPRPRRDLEVVAAPARIRRGGGTSAVRPTLSSASRIA